MAFDKNQIRREKAARMEIASVYTDAEIAAVIGLTPGGLANLKRHPHYRDIIVSLKEGTVRDMDLAIAEDVGAMRKRIREFVPHALRTIMDAASQRRDLKLAVQASNDIIAIDGRFAKVERIGLPTAEQGGVGASTNDPEMVNALTAALASRARKSIQTEPTINDPPITESIS